MTRIAFAVALPRTWLLGALLFPGILAAQAQVTSADSALVGRILLAEDTRDLTSPALKEGTQNADPRIQLIARRALARISDSLFAARDSFPPLPAPPLWPEPEWKSRYRGLTPRSDCAAVRAGITDTSWIVRLRAVDVVPASCTDDDSLDTTIRHWILTLPTTLGPHRSGEVSWHPAGHAIVTLARLRPAEARTLMPLLEKHSTRQVRLYAARAAAVLHDTLRLRRFADDPDDNVKEVAVDALHLLTGHADDRIYLAALRASGAQAVRAAALALKGSPDPQAAQAALTAFQRWAGKNIASARDARLALLDAANHGASDDRPPRETPGLPRDAVVLALGAESRLRVTMEGGPSFVVRLRGDVAPVMAARILDLARQRYYDALVWQRVEPDFVIQGGGPGANEYVGAARFLRDELGTIPHPRGAVGMSTRGHDTGDAQWFIDLKDNPRLRRDYTVFGEVVEGMEVVDAILEGDRIATIREIPKP